MENFGKLLNLVWKISQSEKYEDMYSHNLLMLCEYFTCTNMHACMHACTDIHTDTHTHTHGQTCMHACKHAHIHTYTKT